ncbi:unnamed protein product [Phaedon cochleariae]|uniref:CRAL-TRIO domain-containing protein n=1 Tax=Phaedon cochleariae TaxID=80249 RepID=A0A9P0DP58_PHACE|nr:unnamed protein product [Phaedon cochleariae]
MDARTNYFDEVVRQSELALKKHQKSKEELAKCIAIIKDWLTSQPHIPEIPDEILIGNFLFMNKFSIESTKQRLDMYYTKQSLIPELFEKNHPHQPKMKLFIDDAYLLPIPKSTDDGYRITVFKLKNTDPAHYNVPEFLGSFFNSLEVRLHEDYFVGEILIYDFKDMSLGHMVKITPMWMKRGTTVLEKVFNNSVHQIHLVNYPSYADPVLRMAKQIMKPKLAERIHLHPTIETITNFIPYRLLPEEFGGKERSLVELHELWKQKLEDYKERFDVLSKLRVDESKRPSPLINDEILGFYGNFKKLDVD